MKNLPCIFIALFVFSCSEKQQTTDKEAQNNQAETITSENFGTTSDSSTIAHIRAEYQHIKSDSAKNKHIFYEAECGGLAGSIDFQVENEQLRRIIYSYGSDHGGITEEYYLSGDSLFFVFTAEGSWMFDANSKDPENPSTIDESIETRIYFQEQKVIKALRKKAKGPTKEVDALMAKAKNENLSNESAEKMAIKFTGIKTNIENKEI